MDGLISRANETDLHTHWLRMLKIARYITVQNQINALPLLDKLQGVGRIRRDIVARDPEVTRNGAHWHEDEPRKLFITNSDKTARLNLIALEPFPPITMLAQPGHADLLFSQVALEHCITVLTFILIQKLLDPCFSRASFIEAMLTRLKPPLIIRKLCVQCSTSLIAHLSSFFVLF